MGHSSWWNSDSHVNSLPEEYGETGCIWSLVALWIWFIWGKIKHMYRGCLRVDIWMFIWGWQGETILALSKFGYYSKDSFASDLILKTWSINMSINCKQCRNFGLFQLACLHSVLYTLLCLKKMWFDSMPSKSCRCTFWCLLLRPVPSHSQFVTCLFCFSLFFQFGKWYFQSLNDLLVASPALVKFQWWRIGEVIHALPKCNFLRSLKF